MKRLPFIIILAAIFFAATSASPLFAQQESRGRGRLSSSEGLSDANHVLAEAAAVYRAVVGSESIPEPVLLNSRCIAVFPRVVTAAFGIGSTFGDGVVFCKGPSGEWGGPVFLSLKGGTVGLQAGVASSDLVLFMSGERAPEEVARGQFAVTGALSAVAGSFDRGLVAPPSGIAAYRQAEGMFIGVTLQGLVVRRNRENERDFYDYAGQGSSHGKQGHPLFERPIPPQSEAVVRELKDILPESPAR